MVRPGCQLKSWYETMKTILQVVTLLCLAPTLLLAEAKIGQPAPNFAAKDVNGHMQRLSDYRGRIVVLEAYNPASPYCQNQYRTRSMQALQQAATTKGVVWLLVDSVPVRSPDYRPPDRLRREFDAQGMKATALLDDSSGAIAKAYGMQTTPEMYVINQQGILVYKGAIDNRPATTGNPRTAKNYVKPVIEGLITGRSVTPSQTKPYGTPIQSAK